LETQLEPIVINPDSLVPPLDRAPILFYLLLLINTAVRMRLPDSEWSDVIIDLDGLDALGRLHFSRNGRPFMSIPLRILRHAEALEQLEHPARMLPLTANQHRRTKYQDQK
jgi:hypothetical protein